MRILTFLTYYYPHWTGLTRHAQLICEGLAAKGSLVDVLTSQHSRALDQNETHNSVRITRLKIWKRISRGVVMPSIFSKAFKLLKGVDILHLHSPLMEASFLTLIARAKGIKVVITHHGDLLLPAGIFNKFVQTCININLQIAGHLSHAIVAYSEDYAKHSSLLRKFPHKIKIIPPPIVIPEPQDNEVQNLRIKHNIKESIIIGVSGRFVEEKGYDILIRAIPILMQSTEDFKIVFTGEYDTVVYENFYSSTRPLLEPYKAHILFLGLLDDKQKLANFYSLCTVLAHPSRSECFGLVQAEAMLCGTPVVVSDIPGGRVPVQLTKMGKLFRSEDPEDLAKVLLEVINNRNQYIVPRNELLQIFDYNSTVEKTQKLFNDLLSNAN